MDVPHPRTYRSHSRQRQFPLVKWWFYLPSVLLFVLIPFTWTSDAKAQSHANHQASASQADTAHDQQGEHARGGWKESPREMNDSEFNHHVAGLCDVLFGLAELGAALQYPRLLWARLVLPSVLSVVGVFMLVWSHPEAWPIGSLGLVETFFGQDREIIEHKFYGVLALAIAFCEALRRIGKVWHPAWAAPLVFLTLIGSLLLFVHSHGDHPASAKIEFHHALLGTVGVCAALSKGLASWMPGASRQFVKWSEVAWSGSVILFGLLLLVYSE